ncbi:peptidase S14 [Microvirga thermotolerans]|uniref:Peptidase S14 n=1 Tax=Microvirga thermotolerans TaxID=2651334 RepID=A0A5P9JX98_9HYPH|nr:peptidase S14 [Microvirga thermotolerans]QFU16761.1 peptidase S14 [Microvirga thermotolerans]
MPDAPHLAKPDIRLYGSVDDAMFHDFQDKLSKLPEGRPVVVELMTFGGDADVGRRIALEVRLARRRTGQDFYFLGKTVVYSSGVTVMAAFPRANRYLTRDTVLLIHGRRMDKQVHFTGSLSTCIQIAKDTLAQLETGVRLEREGFAELIAGSDVGEEEIFRLAETSWYLTADEALSRGLIAGIL